MRHILHADFDAFYTSVEQLDNPELRDKPVVVGGRPENRGVVASASYEARRFGIRSAMPMRTALQQCPQAILVRPRFDRYGEVSRQVMAIFQGFTSLVEPLSLDEAYLDVTDSVTQQEQPGQIGKDLKTRVESELHLTISVGVATTKSVAKIASDMDKPNGLTIVPPGTERNFLAPLAVNKLWGIGPKTATKLATESVHTIGDLAAKSEEWCSVRFGKLGPEMRLMAQGKDKRAVITGRSSNSVSAETTLSQDTEDPEALFELVNRLSQRVGNSLSLNDLRGRTVKLKLRLADFTTFTRQTTVVEPVSAPNEVALAATELLRAELQPGRLFRLVGVGVSGFEDITTESLQLRLEGF